MKIIDPHLVSTFFDDFKRAYLHSTAEFENRSSWLAECSISIQVTAEVEGSICLIEHLLSQDLKIPPKTRNQYTFPPVSSICPGAYMKSLITLLDLFQAITIY